jgi:alpha-tubulin suppressor-like RCC1 family protein
VREIPLHLRRRLAEAGQPKLRFGRHARRRKGIEQLRITAEEGEIPSSPTLVDFALTYDATIVVSDDGKTWGAGYGLAMGYWQHVTGDLGDTNDTEWSYPFHYLGLDNVFNIAMTYDNSIALRYDGTAWAVGDNAGWGGNSLGLGEGVDDTMNPPGNWEHYVWKEIPNTPQFTQVAAGHNGATFMAIDTDGRLWTWGDDSYYQASSSEEFSGIYVPTRAHFLDEIVSVSVSSEGEFFYALKGNGTLLGWGAAFYGTLGLDPYDNDYVRTPRVIATDVQSMSAGNEHGLFIKKDGTLWGLGWESGLGLNEDGDGEHYEPVQVPGITAKAVSCGDDWTAIIDGDNNVQTTGWNYDSALGRDTANNYDFSFQPIGITAVKIKTGPYQGIALEQGCTLKVWGSSDELNLGTEDQEWGAEVQTPTSPIIDKNWIQDPAPGGIIDIDAAGRNNFTGRSVALYANGDVWEWGNLTGSDFAHFEGNVPGGVAIATNEIATYVLKDDGTVWYKGRLTLSSSYWPSEFEQVPGTLPAAFDLQGNPDMELKGEKWHMFCKTGSTLYVIGGSEHGTLGTGGEWVSTGQAFQQRCYQSALTWTQVNFTNVSNTAVEEFATGDESAAAVMGNGVLCTWGYGGFGETVDDFLKSVPDDAGGDYAPLEYPGPSISAAAIEMAGYNLYTTASTQNVFNFGNNNQGQLGEGDTDNLAHWSEWSSVFGQVGPQGEPPFNGAEWVCAGWSSIVADGASEVTAIVGRHAWGSNWYGMLGDPDNTNLYVTTPTHHPHLEAYDKLAAGRYHMFGIINGVAYAWGYDWDTSTVPQPGGGAVRTPSRVMQEPVAGNSITLNPCPNGNPSGGDNSDAQPGDNDPQPEGGDGPTGGPTPWSQPPGPPTGDDPDYPKPFTPDPGNFLPGGGPNFDPNNPDTWPPDFNPEDPNFDPENPDTWPENPENPDFTDPDFDNPNDPNFNNPEFNNPFDPSFDPTDPIFDPTDPTFPNVEGNFPTGPNQFPMPEFSTPMPDDIETPEFPGVMPDYLPGADIAPYFPDPFPADWEYPEMPCFGCGEIGEITIPEFPIDPCFELPAMEGYDPCGSGSGGGSGGGGYDGGGWSGGTGPGSGGDWGGGGDIGVPGDGGGVIPDPWPDGTDIDVVVDPPYSTDDTFAEKTCYTDASARAVLNELAARVGVDPANVTYEDERDRNFTKCFEAGTRIWDAIWWLADYLGYVVFDPGDYNIEIVPPEPLDIFWVHNEYIDLIEFTRNYDAMEVHFGVEVYRPESVRGGVVAIPSFSWLEPVDTMFSVDPTSILRIQALPEWTDQQCIDHAKQQAAMMKTGLNVTIATPLNMRARFRHQIIVAKPSRNFYMRFMIMKTVHSLSSNGNLSIHECVFKGVVDGAVAHQQGLANRDSGYADYFLGRAVAVSPPTISAMGIGGV